MCAPAAVTTATVSITTNVGKRFNCWGDLKGLILSTDKPNLYTYNDNMQVVVEGGRSNVYKSSSCIIKSKKSCLDII